MALAVIVLYIASASPSAPANRREMRCDAVSQTANCIPRLVSVPNALRGASMYGLADGGSVARGLVYLAESAIALPCLLQIASVNANTVAEWRRHITMARS